MQSQQIYVTSKNHQLFAKGGNHEFIFEVIG